MWRHRFARAALAGLVCLAGCAADHDARMLIEPAPVFGQMALSIAGDDNDLSRRGVIDLHVCITADDGADVDAWVIRSYRAGSARATAILLHPLGLSKSWFLPLGRLLSENGWDVVLVDLRGHGHSSGRYITWGVKERYDIKKLVDDLLARRAIQEQIYVMGASLGGCVAIQYAAIDPRCKGVLAFAPPAGIRPVADLFLPLRPANYLDQVVLRAGQLAAFDPAQANTVEAARRLNCPLIIAYGVWDFIVPYQHSQQIYDVAAGRKKLIPVFFANHITLQIGRDSWLMEQMNLLEEMGRDINVLTRAGS